MYTARKSLKDSHRTSARHETPLDADSMAAIDSKVKKEVDAEGGNEEGGPQMTAEEKKKELLRGYIEWLLTRVRPARALCHEFMKMMKLSMFGEKKVDGTAMESILLFARRHVEGRLFFFPDIDNDDPALETTLRVLPLFFSDRDDDQEAA